MVVAPIINKRLLRLPNALWAQALLIQCMSMLLITLALPSVINSIFVFEVLHICSSMLGVQVSPFILGLVGHLVLVTVLAAYCRMPMWWRWIHVLFPLAVVACQQVVIPDVVYLAGFLITLSIYWSVHQTRVPFYPSFPATWSAIHHYLNHYAGARGVQVLDIGSGIGDVGFYLARQRPQDHVAGIEIAPLPWALSAVRAWCGRRPVKFHYGDYAALDFATFDVIFAYLSPAVMAAVWQQASTQMRAGSVLISSEFPIPGVTPSHTLSPAEGAPALFVYHF